MMLQCINERVDRQRFNQYFHTLRENYCVTSMLQHMFKTLPCVI